MCAVFILSTFFLFGCASVKAANEASDLSEAQYAADHCKFLGGLFKDKSLNDSLAVVELNGGTSSSDTEVTEDKLSWPWDNRHDAKVSRDRAALRKAHRQKGCAN